LSDCDERPNYCRLNHQLLNDHILDSEVQQYINHHLNDDVHKIAMAKSPFPEVSSKELANQIAAKNKSVKKLPTWYHQERIYYPLLLSIEQCSSESTAAYKASLVQGATLIDLTGGFGVDSLYFSKRLESVTQCEINEELSAIAAHNATALNQDNIQFLAGDGMAYLRDTKTQFDNIYIDPARRSQAGKVFMLKDCTPDVVTHLDLLLSHTNRIIIKTAPLLDISAGLKELKNVAEVHVVSVRNECKELIWILQKTAPEQVKIVSTTLNEQQKSFSFFKGEEDTAAEITAVDLQQYLYEPDTALLKGGAFNLIASRYGLQKLHSQTQLYTSDHIVPEFPGRRFRINRLLPATELKKEKDLRGNVIARNYQDKAENLVKKYKIKPDNHRFLIFTQSKKDGYLIIDATIEQHY
jgi:16S rRNA G966 N2-methylase RsmD